MDEDLKKVIGETGTEPKSSSEVALGETTPSQAEIQEKRASEHAQNLRKAIDEGNAELKRIRDEKRKAIAGTVEEDELPKIDMGDPSAKAWDNHIRKNVAPMATEIEREKDEVRSYALKEFLADKPALAGNSEKLKQVLGTYDRLKTSTEKTREGVLMDLEKAYAAEHAEELMEEKRRVRVDQARNDMLYAAPAISSGSTGYAPDAKQAKRNYSEEEKRILANWEASGAPKMD